MALKIVGSSPIIHPMKKALASASAFFRGVNGTRRGRPNRREGKKVSGGHFFSPGESPCTADGSRYGCWRTSLFCIRGPILGSNTAVKTGTESVPVFNFSVDSPRYWGNSTLNYPTSCVSTNFVQSWWYYVDKPPGSRRTTATVASSSDS